MEISPEKQNIDQLFASRSYDIDFYQRDYKWGKAEVQRLLEDVAWVFDQEYSSKSAMDVTTETVDSYSWYYLNTYITNKAEGKNFVVDGQQRLTTLCLILLKLYHLSKSRVPDRVDLLRDRIAGSAIEGKVFWLAHESRKDLMHELLQEPEKLKKSDAYSNSITLSNMITNYFVISSFLDEYLVDDHKLKTFILYFLRRLVIVNLDIQPRNVPMVFEVINDRGVRLNSFEILKGKILGKLSKKEVNSKYHEIWQRCMRRKGVQSNEDTFWESLLKSRFADSMAQAQTWDKNYHRKMFEEPFVSELGLNDQLGIKRFLEVDLEFYTKLYSVLARLGERWSKTCPEAYYNIALNDLDGATMLCMAVCSPEDKDFEKKALEVNRVVDRLHAQIRLCGIYESRKFLDLLYELKPKLIGLKREEFEDEATELALTTINSRLDGSYSSPFIWQRFRNVGYGELETRFIRYLLARIEHWLSQICQQELRDNFYNLVRNNGKIEGYHIEHILSRNDTNKEMFESEELFEQERNRIGGLLLLRGSANISSGNEEYEDKKKSYSGTLFWNESLLESFYHSNVPLKKFLNKSELNFGALDYFGPEELEQRTHLMFNLAREIWKTDEDNFDGTTVSSP